MSVSHIENYPTDADAVETVDPDTDIAPEPTGGIDHDESDYYGQARKHVDPLGTALMRLGVGRSRELSESAAHGLSHMDHPHRSAGGRGSSIETGTDLYPDRYVHDEALQVRQLVPTDVDNTNYALNSVIPVQVAPERPERMTMVLINYGADTVWWNKNQNKALAGIGAPILAGGAMVINATCAIWASVATGTSSTLAVVEQWRADNGAM